MAVDSTYSPRGLGYKDEINLESTSYMLWRKLADKPIFRNWKVANDALFMATGLPYGVAFFVVGVTGLAAGLPLLFLGVGFLVLAMMFAGFGLIGKVERARLNALIGAGVPSHRVTPAVSGGILHQARAFIAAPSLHRELIYGAIMFPLSIFQLAVVTLPLSYMMAPLTQPIFGSITPGFSFWHVDSGFEALLSFGFGALLIVPVAFLCNIGAALHREFARKLLG